MITRSKLVAAVLGLAVAVAATGSASAKTIVIKTAAAHKVTRVHVGAAVKHPVIAHTRIVRHVKLLHRTPSHVKVLAAKRAPIVKRPLLQRQAMAHRTIVRKTIIR